MSRFVKISLFALVAALAMALAGCEGEKEIKVTGGKIPVETTIKIVNDLDKPQSGEDSSASLFEAEKKDDEDQVIQHPDEKEDPEDADAKDADSEEDKTEDEGKEDEDAKEEDADKADDKPVTPGSKESVGLNASWKYADFSKINSGSAVLYRAADNRKNVVIGVNAGHGTKGGSSVKTYCHPDMSPKTTGGSTAAGSLQAAAVSGGMSFADGASEASVTLRTAQLLRDKLLAKGYDVLMLRDDSDVQLDNVARTVIANNTAACHIALHWDGDGLDYDKGAFYISVPDGIKGMEPVASHWQQHNALGDALIAGLSEKGCKIYKGGSMAVDLTQTSYSTIPSVDIELGNQSSAHDDASLGKLADGLAAGIAKKF